MFVCVVYVQLWCSVGGRDGCVDCVCMCVNDLQINVFQMALGALVQLLFKTQMLSLLKLVSDVKEFGILLLFCLFWGGVFFPEKG